MNEKSRVEMKPLSEIHEFDDALILTMSKPIEELLEICKHYEVTPKPCASCGAICPTACALAIFEKAAALKEEK